MEQKTEKAYAFETGCEHGDEFLAYWRAMPKRGEQGLPARIDLNPADIKPLLPYIYLVEWRDHGHARIRLRGTWLDDHLARPKDNYNLFEQYSGDHRES